MTMLHPAIPPLAAVAGFVLTAIALWMAFGQEIRQLQHAQRFVLALGVVLVVAGATIYAQAPNGACMEATLRHFCGDYWWECGLALGCWMLPGGG